MEAFNEIRKCAREKRDRAISQARAEYADMLTRIVAIEPGLLGRQEKDAHKLSTCIHRVMPADGPFTVLDLVAALEGLDPTRIWPKRSVERYVSRLRERRVVRRMCRAKGLAPALYVREGVEVPPLPFEDKTLAEVATEVLAARTMSQTELVVAMLEAGYQTSMTRRRLRDAVVHRGRTYLFLGSQEKEKFLTDPDR